MSRDRNHPAKEAAGDNSGTSPGSGRSGRVAGAVVLMVAIGVSSIAACSDPVVDPPISIDAGDDQTVRLNQRVDLDGRRSILSPIEFWLADGDGPIEDRLVEYHSRRGVSSRTLRDALNKPLGWPGDMVWVGDDLVGIDTSKHRIVLIVPESSSFRYLTEPLEDYPRLMGLAYDVRKDRLLVVDSETRELLAVNLHTGKSASLCKLSTLENLTGLAYSESTDSVFAYDEGTRGLYHVRPEAGTTALVTTLRVPAGAICDEIAMFRGEMYCTVGKYTPDLRRVQVCRVDMTTGDLENVGPEVENTVGHSLVMQSIPERPKWRLVNGPSGVQIAEAHSLTTTVTFPGPGEYEFELSVVGSPEVNDTVKFTVVSSKEKDE